MNNNCAWKSAAQHLQTFINYTICSTYITNQLKSNYHSILLNTIFSLGSLIWYFNHLLTDDGIILDKAAGVVDQDFLHSKIHFVKLLWFDLI